MGFVFNFITYGGHQIDGLAAEEFAAALREDGMLALARLQRKFRLLESPYRTPQTLVGGPRADAGLMSLSGRTSTTKAMGKGSTQQPAPGADRGAAEAPRGVARPWAEHHGIAGKLKVSLRPQHAAGSDLLELSVPAPRATSSPTSSSPRSRTAGAARSSRSATRTPSTPTCAASGS